MNKMLSLLRIRTNTLNKSVLTRPYFLLRIFGFFDGSRHDIRYRLSIGGNFGKISVILSNINNMSIWKWKNQAWRDARSNGGRLSKNHQFFFKISMINRRFFRQFFEISSYCIQRLDLNFWQSDGLDFTRVFYKGIQQSDLWSNGGKLIMTWSNG